MGRASRALDLLLTLLLIKLGTISETRKSYVTRTPLVLFLLWLFKCYYFLIHKGYMELPLWIHAAEAVIQGASLISCSHKRAKQSHNVVHGWGCVMQTGMHKTHFSAKEHHVVPCLGIKVTWQYCQAFLSYQTERSRKTDFSCWDCHSSFSQKIFFSQVCAHSLSSLNLSASGM